MKEELTMKLKQTKKSLIAQIMILTGLMLNMNSLTQAQESTAQIPKVVSSDSSTVSTETKQVERVEVIGSRIKRINKEGSTAVKNVGKESMKNSANTSASDSLRDSTVSTYGAAREASGGGAAATSTVGLRGFGDTRTLVLLNGHRLPKDPSYEAVDLNLIPQIAIERVEVLKDGASALYGSDALGGVINIVTKKGYIGTEASVKLSGVEKPGGTTYDVALLTGMSGENSDFMAVMNYTHTDKIFGKDRPLVKDGLSAAGSTASWNDGTSWQTGVDCPPDLKKTKASGSRCYFRYNEIATVRPQIGQLNLFTDYTYRLNSGMKIYNRNLIVHKDIEWSYAPAPGVFENGNPAHADELPTGTATQPGAQVLTYRYMDAGNRDNHDTEFNYSSLVGLKGSLTSIWEYDVAAGFSQINRKDKGTNGYLDKKVLIDAIGAGTHDPAAPPGDARRNIPAGAQVDVFQNSRSDLLTLDVVMTGELGEMTHGPIGVATGLSLFNEKLIQETDDKSIIPDRVIGTSGSRDSGERDVQSVFIEASLPVLASLELDAAARLDHYSDFGTSVNPKLAAKYTINSGFILRSSVGTGFKAPTLSQLYGASSDGYQTFIDRKLCAADSSRCDAEQWHIFGGGNKNLKEEKAFSASLGTVVQPASNFSISVDGWYTKVSNIVDIDFEDVTQAELNGTNLSQHGITVTRDPGTGEIQNINAPNLNLASEAITGIDMNAEVIITNDFFGHELGFENDFSYIVSDIKETFPGLPTRDIVGEWGMPRWRNTASLNMKNDKITYGINMRSIPGQGLNDRFEDGKISDLNEFDVSVAYKFEKTSQLGGGIKNIMDAAQPVDKFGGTGGAAAINNDLYDVNGRKFYVSYSQKF